MSQLNLSTCLVSAPWKKADKWRMPADGPALAQPPDNRQRPLRLCKELIYHPTSLTGQHKLPQLSTVLTLWLCVRVLVHSHGPSSNRGVISLMKSWQAFDLIKTEEGEESWPHGGQRSQPRQQIPRAIKHTQSCIHLLETQTHPRTFSPSDHCPSRAWHYPFTFLWT